MAKRPKKSVCKVCHGATFDGRCVGTCRIRKFHKYNSHYKYKLTPSEQQEIADSTESQLTLARRFHVSRFTIHKIKSVVRTSDEVQEKVNP